MVDISAAKWRELSPLLDELLEAPHDERKRRLAEIGVNDEALAVQLQTLLEEHATIERDAFLEGGAFSAPSLAGQTVGAYTLERPLGEGGMGAVWLGHRSDGRYEGKVAVKFLNLTLLARGGAARFAREGNMLARLTHPNIARLLDAGVATSTAVGGQPYLVLEYIEGVPIDRYCDSNALSIDKRLRLFLDVLAAVAHAHNNLILHRDLKPSNILVTAQGEVKLLDFGIGKLLAEQNTAASATELTHLAGHAFTPDYAAPEQVQRGDVTTATDVYALGVLLYQLLAGRHPTALPTQTAVDRVRAVVEKEPAPVSTAAAKADDATVRARATLAHKLARTLSGDLDNIVAKALKKQAAERYPTAAALADDLRRYLDNKPVSARPDSLAYRASKFVRRYRLAVGAASVTLLTLAAGVIGTTWQAVEARRERDEARFQAERAFAKSNLVSLMLSAMGDADRPLTQREILDRSVILVEKQFTRDPRIAVDLLLPIAGQYLTLGDAESELAVMQRAGAIAGGSSNPSLIADVACNIVETHMRRGQIALAEEQLRVGLAALDQIRRPDIGTTSACLQADAEIAQNKGDLDRALASTMNAVNQVERSGSTRGSGYPRLLSFLGVLHLRRGELRASYEVSRRLQRLDEESGRAETVDFLLERRNDAVLLVAMGEYRSARAILDSLALRWRAVSGDDGAPPWLGLSRGYLMLFFGELDEAQSMLGETVHQFRSQGNADRAASAEFALAQVLVQKGQFDEAERLLVSAESRRPPGPGRYTLITPATVRTILLLAQKDTSDATRLIEEELARLRQTSGKSDVLLAAALRVAAKVHLAANNPQGALNFATEAAALSEHTARDSTHSAHVGEALLLLAQAQHALGKRTEAGLTAKRATVSLVNALGEEHELTRSARALVDG